jgi:hypothetical protein
MIFLNNDSIDYLKTLLLHEASQRSALVAVGRA